MLRFCYWLGDRLGRTVEEIGKLPLTRLAEYAAFYQDYDPDERIDMRHAVLCTVINRSAGGEARIETFLPRQNRTSDAGKSEDEVRRWAMAWASGKPRLNGE